MTRSQMMAQAVELLIEVANQDQEAEHKCQGLTASSALVIERVVAALLTKVTAALNEALIKIE